MVARLQSITLSNQKVFDSFCCVGNHYLLVGGPSACTAEKIISEAFTDIGSSDSGNSGHKMAMSPPSGSGNNSNNNEFASAMHEFDELNMLMGNFVIDEAPFRNMRNSGMNIGYSPFRLSRRDSLTYLQSLGNRGMFYSKGPSSVGSVGSNGSNDTPNSAKKTKFIFIQYVSNEYEYESK